MSRWLAHPLPIMTIVVIVAFFLSSAWDEHAAFGQSSGSTAYEQAKSAVYLATRSLERMERLYAEKLATNDQMAEARKALEAAKMQLDAAEASQDSGRCSGTAGVIEPSLSFCARK